MQGSFVNDPYDLLKEPSEQSAYLRYYGASGKRDEF